jgi:NTE family protein
VFPLIQEHTSHDILLVLLAPHQHDETPQAMHAIETRIQELGFKTHFLREMNMYARSSNASRDLPNPWSAQKQVLQQTRFHMIDSNLDVLQRSETQMLAYTPFLEMLKGQGVKQANVWLSRHSSSVGKHSSIDLTQWLN